MQWEDTPTSPVRRCLSTAAAPSEKLRYERAREAQHTNSARPESLRAPKLARILQPQNSHVKEVSDDRHSEPFGPRAGGVRRALAAVWAFLQAMETSGFRG